MEITIKTNDGPFVLEGIATRTPGLVVTPAIRKFTGSKTEIVPKSWTITHEAWSNGKRKATVHLRCTQQGQMCLDRQQAQRSCGLDQ